MGDATYPIAGHHIAVFPRRRPFLDADRAADPQAQGPIRLRESDANEVGAQEHIARTCIVSPFQR